MRSEMSLAGLYNYDPHIFDNLMLPMATDRFIDLLLIETADLEVLFPDPEFMKAAIGRWSGAMMPEWGRIKKALEIEYIVNENYDRNETWTDNATRTDNLTTSESGSQTGSGTVGGTAGRTVTASKKGYNSGGFVASDKEQTDETTSNTTSDSLTTSNTTTNTGTVGQTGSRTGHVHGNIGVTTNQQMITAEIQMRVEYNLYNIIINQFKQKFCILVY